MLNFFFAYEPNRSFSKSQSWVGDDGLRHRDSWWGIRSCHDSAERERFSDRSLGRDLLNEAFLLLGDLLDSDARTLSVLCEEALLEQRAVWWLRSKYRQGEAWHCELQWPVVIHFEQNFSSTTSLLLVWLRDRISLNAFAS